MSGIHHVTAIAGDPARNVDFYTRVLGLRMVKKTVNYDDPGTYHFYFGDEAGNPGTILTFFPWAHVPRGRGGIGGTHETAFRVPEGAMGFWAHRFIEKGVTHELIAKRFGQPVLAFTDPDGTRLALVGVKDAEAEAAWTGNGVDAAHAIRGFHGVTLLLEEGARTAAVLTDVLGFRKTATEGTVTRYVADATVGGVVDIHEAGGFLAERQGTGSVHHVAFRARDDAEQAEMRRKLVEVHRLHVTEQINRTYFRSLYFQSPGGVLFEIATDEPGFAVDEPKATLGESLVLPAFLERRRAQIEATLVPVSGEPTEKEAQS
jgi:glyoxalase family protein